MELMDMPGVLWPKFEDKTVGEHLAFTGAVRTMLWILSCLPCGCSQVLAAEYPEALKSGIRFEIPQEIDGYELLCAVGEKSAGCLFPAVGKSTSSAAIAVLDEFRGGKLGRISLEKPPKES